MSSIEILQDIARRPLEEAQALRPALTPGLLNAHPQHHNSIAWLLWHSAREIDEQLASLSGAETVWTAQGFAERFGLNLTDHEMGFGHTGTEARRIRADDPELLLEHLRAVGEAQLSYLESLDDADLEQIVDPQWDPPVTRAARLISISLDAVAHIAQATYIIGMDPVAFEEPLTQEDHQDQAQEPR
ncbi:DinB family protein [Nesterenkonia sp. E16_7]|uniref:mycothiol transferase n=1 Tax=unclassified Nesterenkonia TaxID=2629769 RepID=UPI001A9333B1|nr:MULTISPECIES: DinB family protein [unclassified Nesterenkonia]MBO0596519.1 DinB family protein [Nesterenkonia sp. E16_10]MBO0597865.1 DinB family protein [Nesterenkonia sp. E16_7]